MELWWNVVSDGQLLWLWIAGYGSSVSSLARRLAWYVHDDDMHLFSKAFVTA